MKGECSVQLLGGFRVAIGGRPIPDHAWRQRRGADLVKILALAPDHRLQREQVMDMLWPDFSVEAAGANLRKAVYFARQALESERAIRVEMGVITLWPEGGLKVDVDEFLSSTATDPATAIACYKGDLLPEDRYAEWTEPRRERLRLRFLDLLKGAGDWERVLEFDRADEDAHRALMNGYLAEGNRRAAIRQFERLREVLRVDLGVGPAPETVELFERAIDHGQQLPTPSERVQALIARGLVRWNLGELDEADSIARQARAQALEQGLGRELGEASTLLGLVAFARGQWGDVFRQEFLDVIEQAPERLEYVLEGHLCLAEGSLYGWQGGDSGALARELLGVAERAGSVIAQAVMHLQLGAIDVLSGEVESSDAELGRALALFSELGAGSGEAASLVWLAERELARSGRPAAADLLARAKPLAESSHLAAHLLVRVFAGLVRSATTLERQLEWVGEAERDLVRSEVCGPCSIGFCVASAIACADAGEMARARKCLHEAERLSGMWQGGPWQAATWEARAHLRQAEGDHDQAAALMREAADLFSQARRPIDASRCQAGLFLRAAGAQ